MRVYSLRISNQKNKKYVADVEINGQFYKNVNFGDKRYQQYRDSTPLKAYSYLDHNDLERKRLYHIRHRKNNKPAGLLSKEFLW